VTRQPSTPASQLWRYTGADRPPFAEAASPDQESVWDYPRPPRLVPDAREVIVRVAGLEIVRTRGALRILETASPPTFYLPFADAQRELLVPSPASRSSRCEWKGDARYWSIRAGDELLHEVGWSYPAARHPYEAIAECFSVYPGRMECLVDGERVRPQDGGFYGGWVTDEIVGPWKGGPGTSGW
jgi:uncharacterized protein (DUF427 family)